MSKEQRNLEESSCWLKTGQSKQKNDLSESQSRNPKPTMMQKILSLHLPSVKLTFTPI